MGQPCAKGTISSKEPVGLKVLRVFTVFLGFGYLLVGAGLMTALTSDEVYWPIVMFGVAFLVGAGLAISTSRGLDRGAYWAWLASLSFYVLTVFIGVGFVAHDYMEPMTTDASLSIPFFVVGLTALTYLSSTRIRNRFLPSQNKDSPKE